MVKLMDCINCDEEWLGIFKNTNVDHHVSTLEITK